MAGPLTPDMENETSIDAASFAAVLEWVSRRTGVKCTATIAQRVGRRALVEAKKAVAPRTSLRPPALERAPQLHEASVDDEVSGGGSVEGWETFFAHAAETFQLRCNHVRVTPEALLSKVHHQLCAVAHHRDEHKNGTWLGIARRAGRRYAIILRCEDKERRATLNRKRTIELLRRYGFGDDQCWLLVQPRYGLASLSQLQAPHPDDPNRPLTPWRRLRRLIYLERGAIWIIFTHALVIGLLTLLTPVATQALVNTIALGSLLQPLFILTAVLSLGLGFRACVKVLETWSVEMLQRRFFVRLAEDLGERLARLQSRVFRERNMPVLMHRFFDVITVQKSIASLMLDGMGLVLQIVVASVLLAFYHPFLLAFVIVLIVSLIVIVTGFARIATATAIQESYAKYGAAKWIHTLVRHPMLFDQDATQKYASEQTQAIVRDYLSAREEHFKPLMKQVVGGLVLQVFAMVTLLGVGGFLVIDRQLTLGQLVASELLLGVTGLGLAKLGKQLEKLYDLLAGLDKIGGLLDLPLEKSGPVHLSLTKPASLELRDFRLSSDRGRCDVTVGKLLAYPGDRIVLDGPAGTGKSLLLDLLYGREHNYEGLLAMDGLDRRQANGPTWRDHVELVGPIEVFNGTVLENLTLGRSDLAISEIWEKLTALSLAEVVRSLPDGLDTVLSSNGAPLSRTERKLLVLTRAVLAKPKLLLVDELLDRLPLGDSQRACVLETLLGRFAPWTAIVVTRDDEVISRCGRTWSIDSGRLDENTPTEDPWS